MSAEKIEQLQTQIIKEEKKLLRFKRLLNLTKRWRGGPYEPTKSDVETWEESGKPGAMHAWEQQGGGLTRKKDKNGNYFYDKKTALKEHEEYIAFCNEYVFELTKEDWLRFYQKLVDDQKYQVKDLEIQLREISSLPKTKSANFKRNNNQSTPHTSKPHKDDIYKKYGALKGEFGVKNAFYNLCDWIENLDCDVDVADYIETDTPENFDKSYREWLKRK